MTDFFRHTCETQFHLLLFQILLWSQIQLSVPPESTFMLMEKGRNQLYMQGLHKNQNLQFQAMDPLKPRVPHLNRSSRDASPAGITALQLHCWDAPVPLWGLTPLPGPPTPS